MHRSTKSQYDLKSYFTAKSALQHSHSACLDQPSTSQQGFVDADGSPDSTPHNLVINPCFHLQSPAKPGGFPVPFNMLPDARESWHLMHWKETIYRRNHEYLSHHPNINPRMRAVLLDWLREVSEMHKLHRETFHLAVDFLDRYFSSCANIDRKIVQLIGVSCLFIAAKLEEIYPPKLENFAFITDGACSVDDILKQEIIILQTLQWGLSPITPNQWLQCFLQTAVTKYIPLSTSFVKVETTATGSDSLDSPMVPRVTSSPDISHDLIDFSLDRSDIDNSNTHEFHEAKFPRDIFVHICELVDLCLLDIGCLRFPYSVIAASAIHLMVEPTTTALTASNYNWEVLEPCVQWMLPFALAVNDKARVDVHQFVKIPQEDMHNIQTHSFDLELLDKAHSFMGVLERQAPPIFSYLGPACQQSSELRTPPECLQKLVRTGAAPASSSASLPSFGVAPHHQKSVNTWLFGSSSTFATTFPKYQIAAKVGASQPHPLRLQQQNNAPACPRSSHQTYPASRPIFRAHPSSRCNEPNSCNSVVSNNENLQPVGDYSASSFIPISDSLLAFYSAQQLATAGVNFNPSATQSSTPMDVDSGKSVCTLCCSSLGTDLGADLPHRQQLQLQQLLLWPPAQLCKHHLGILMAGTGGQVLPS